MMKKKVKKIPKYSLGAIAAEHTDLSIKRNPAGEAYREQMTRKFLGSGEEGSGISMPGGIATASNEMLTNLLGIEDNSQAGVTLNSAAQGADIGGSIVPGWGHLIGGVAGGLMGSLKKGSVDEFGNITYGGIFGRSKSSLQREANAKKNSIAAVTHTLNLQADYYNNPNITLQPTTAAEGGIMRLPVDALVSKGELIYNPMTKKLSKIPGSKGKPNKADDVYVRLYEGDVVISNSPTMLMANGKTPALNLEGLVDKYATGGTVKAREAIIKKVVNWQEANKTKPQEFGKFEGGWDGEIKSWEDYLNRNYKLTKDNKIESLDDFWGYDSKNKKYNSSWDKLISHIGNDEKLRAKAIKDLSGLRYIGDGKNAWDNIVKAAYDTKPADVHRYFKSFGDILSPANALKQPIVGLGEIIKVPYGISQKNVRSSAGGVDFMRSYIPETEPEKLTKLTPEQVKALGDKYVNIKGNKKSSNANSKENKVSNWINNISDLIPTIAALFGDYDYHKEQAYINPAKYIPTGVNIEPLRRAADESYAMARYNQANISPNTGAGMAYGLQAASNRAKSVADAYKWQQEQQNKLIAQNIGIYNDWAAREAQARHIANTETRQNEGAAQQMRDAAIRDAYEFQTGRRNDRWKLSMLEPLFEYAVDDKIYKQFKV